MATHSSMLAWETPGTEEPGGLSPWGRKELGTTERLSICTCDSLWRKLNQRKISYLWT